MPERTQQLQTQQEAETDLGRVDVDRCPALGPRGVRCGGTADHRGSHFAMQVEWDDPPVVNHDLDTIFGRWPGDESDRELHRGMSRDELSADHCLLAEALGLDVDDVTSDAVARRALVVIEGLRSRLGRRR